MAKTGGYIWLQEEVLQREELLDLQDQEVQQLAVP
jgi:hypothetical protein